MRTAPSRPDASPAPSGLASKSGLLLGATLASALVIAQLVCAKAARDALFLASFDVKLLPRMVAAAAAVSVLSAFASARASARGSPARVMLVALSANAALYLAEGLAITALPDVVAITLYVQVAAFGALLIAGLWSLVNERFDPHAARRQVGRIALGGALGGALAGPAGWALGSTRGVQPMLILLVVLNLAGIGAVLLVARARRSGSERKTLLPKREAAWSLKTLRDTSYLRTLALLVVLTALSSTLLDYVLSARAVGIYRDTRELAAFFSLFHTAVGMISVLVQLTLARVVLDRFGLAGTLATLPGAVFVSGAVALVVPRLWSAALLRGSEALLQGSLYRSAYELLYTPLPRSQKRPAKMLIDVGFDRFGMILGAGVTTLVVTYLPAIAPTALVALAMLIAAATAVCAARLSRGYVEALAASLRRGIVKLDEHRVFDATTRRTLAETAELDRRELLREIARHRSEAPPPIGGSERPEARADTFENDAPDTGLVAAGATAGFAVVPGYVGFGLDEPSGGETPSEADPVVEGVRVLRSGDAERIRQLFDGELAIELVPHAIALLEHDELSRDALSALRRVAPRIVGQLVDVLGDAQRSAVVRRRIPRVLEVVRSDRAIDGLLDGLASAELEVRQQCALALLRQKEKSVASESAGGEAWSKLLGERALDAILRELRVPLEPGAAKPRTGRDAFADEAPFSVRGLGEIVDPRVEHVIVLLSLVLEPEPLRLAYHALFTDDEAIRGTALEYLDNVLPERVKHAVSAFLGESGIARARAAPAARDNQKLVEELLRSRDDILAVNLEGLRRIAGARSQR